MSAVLSLLQSRLLRPVFVTLGIALLVQVLVAVALTRSTVTALESDLDARLGADSQKLTAELEQAGREVKSSLDALSASTRQRLTAGLEPRLKDEQMQLRQSLEKNLQDSANDMAQLLAAVAPRAIWDSDVPTLSDFARRAQRNPNVLFVVYDDATLDFDKLTTSHPLFLVLTTLVEDNREPALLLGKFVMALFNHLTLPKLLFW